ncbi:helix-turn-helix transcriptional regulator [Flagellimonas pacifica]|uniref:AraC-type DNA-binding protein n=1 Tax=Flagellimonas pacifica TaxID=1247520 RepID=A0A285MR52_9FLAO|nr:helix-turn-helix transcriptional regulator [Allomuricauda parva]SNY99654.1 AraC-type DNA-binding protein [Allomuricauda parva]
MSFVIHTDLVSLFRSLVTGLQPFAIAQDVELIFESSSKSLLAKYNPEEILSEITMLLSRIVTFTPQLHQVKVALSGFDQNGDQCILTVENSGVDLSKIGEIISTVSRNLSVEKLKQGTRFVVLIPIMTNPLTKDELECNDNLLPKSYPMYFSAVSKRLSVHFSNTENMEKAAYLRDSGEGVFLRKVNAVIHSNMADSDFKVDALASAMALSRTQLFRKIKNLTRMSPQQYLRYVRLEKAKKLLQSKDKDMNVGEVGYEVGFVSKSHFTRSFQNEFGFNPSDFI